MATPISIYGRKSISETVNVRGLNVCLKEAEWPYLYSTCEPTYAETSFVFELFAKNCLFCRTLEKNGISETIKAIKSNWYSKVAE